MSLDDISKQRKASQPKAKVAKRKTLVVKKVALPAKKATVGKAARKTGSASNGADTGRKGRQNKLAPYTKPAGQSGRRSAGTGPRRPLGPWRVNVGNLATATTLPYLIEGMQGAGIVSSGHIAMNAQGQSLVSGLERLF